MIDTPLIKTLRNFSIEDIRWLDKFISSPYHNSNKNVIKLFEILKPFAPDFKDEAAISKARVHAKLGEEKNLEKISSNLHTVVQNFINWAYLEVYGDKFYQQLGLLDFYLKKMPKERFEGLFNKMEEELIERMPKEGNEIYYKLFQLHYRKTDWMQTHQPILDINLINTIKNFNFYTIIQKAQLIVTLILRSNNASFEDQTSTIKNFLAEAELFHSLYSENSLAPSTLLEMLILEIKLLINDGSVEFKTFQDKLKESKNQLSENDYKNLASFERNELLRTIKEWQWKDETTKTVKELTQEIFELYERHLHEKLIAHKDLKPTHFANIVRFACRCGKLSRAESFLKTCEQSGFSNTNSDMYSLMLAYYFLFQEDYSEALDHLSFNFKKTNRRLDAYCYQLMILSQCQFQNFSTRIDNFSRMLRKPNGKKDENGKSKDSMENPDESYHNFVKALRKLIKLDPRHETNPNLKKDLKQYNDEIREAIKDIERNKTAESIWLIKQFEKLKSKG